MLNRIFVGALVWSWLVAAYAEEGVSLQVERDGASSRARISSAGRTNQVHVLEGSGDLLNWSEVAVLHHGPFRFMDFGATTEPWRFYRTRSRLLTANDDAKNQILFPSEPFANSPFQFYTPPGNDQIIRWIKFALLLPRPDRVWFQDSGKYTFHYEFASRRLAPFNGMAPPDFDAATLYRTNQRAVLGAVLLPPRPSYASPFEPPQPVIHEFALQFVGKNPYPREDVAEWFDLVREAVLVGIPPAKALYFPTFEQAGVAEANRSWFAERGITVSSPERWLVEDTFLVSGWAIGRLTFVPSGEIQAAYADGRLRPGDILLTDVLPAEVPFTAGIISLTPATPNCHAAIQARASGIPLVWLAGDAARSNLLTLAGREVALRAEPSGGDAAAVSDSFRRGVTVVDVEGTLSPALREEILALKKPGRLKVQRKALLGRISTNATELRPADTMYVGGKAANFGLLRRVLPTNSPPAIALTFDLWDEFMQQPLPDWPDWPTLRAMIDTVLAGNAWPPNIAWVRGNLAVLRDVIRKQASFSPARQQEIIAALGGFDPQRKIRFRSSTNVEDTDTFVGAGLYDSCSGCLADDLDGDVVGPSACDPAEPEERGVFRAIQRVYSSFYNENAYLERLRLGVYESDVGMAVLVHHSFPDESELANGVATFQWPSGTIELVTQLGAESVTNPDGTVRPERAKFVNGNPYLVEGSCRVQLGDTVMQWETDYRAFATMFGRVAEAYATLFPAKTKFLLDFEYKKEATGQLQVKQVRELPLPATAPAGGPFLLNEPVLVVEQGYSADQSGVGSAFTIHRLKSRWSLGTRCQHWAPASLAASIYTNVTVTMRERTNLVQWTNGMTTWPNAGHAIVTNYAGTSTVDSWTFGEGNDRRCFSLATDLSSTSISHLCPWFTPGDFRMTLNVTYAVPVPTVDLFTGKLVFTTTETVWLIPPPSVGDKALLQRREFAARSGVRVTAEFYWPEEAATSGVGYTAPCMAWVQTRIEGLTTQPIVLRGEWSQTYYPRRHNFGEEFIFEPRLEDGLTAGQLAELESADLGLIYAQYQRPPGSPDTGYRGLFLVGRDGTLRPL